MSSALKRTAMAAAVIGALSCAPPAIASTARPDVPRQRQTPTSAPADGSRPTGRPAFGGGHALAGPQATAAAAWLTNDQARAALTALLLTPAALYPSVLPARLEGAGVQLDTSDGYTVIWDRGATVDQQVGFVALTRAQRSTLHSDLQVSRRRGHRPRRVRVGDRSVWHLCGHVCGYAWEQDGRYYGVFGVYYAADETGSMVASDERAIIRSLQPLV